MTCSQHTNFTFGIYSCTRKEPSKTGRASSVASRHSNLRSWYCKHKLRDQITGSCTSVATGRQHRALQSVRTTGVSCLRFALTLPRKAVHHQSHQQGTVDCAKDKYLSHEKFPYSLHQACEVFSGFNENFTDVSQRKILLYLETRCYVGTK
jgi:hypothetical protein